MSNYALRVPDSLFEYAKELAKKENCSLNQLIVTALAEKVSSIRTEEFFRERIARGRNSPYTLEDLLDMAPQGAPLPGDELPAGFDAVPSAQEPRKRYNARRSGSAKVAAPKRGPTHRKK